MNERAIFMEALERDTPARRSAYLAEACGGNAALRQRVEALLASDEQAGSFLGKPIPERLAEKRATAEWAGPAPMDTRDGAEPGLATTLEPAVSERTGTAIGPYQLVEQLGEGGMGTVFLARQQHPVRRTVALKLIKPGMDSRQVIARFEAERQALALMDHPNIAKVLDAGTTDTGRPFFVMELVQGIAITSYCDEHHLTPRQRLELFVPICQAVQHAHQKGIIHRDIKPSNVLVCLYDGQPVPKVIDFGIAKATQQPLTEQTLTGMGLVVGTLEYMSPEGAELNQHDIDTRSDIYSLGVLLYELLTGTTPLEKKQLKQAAMLEVLRLIREQEPPRPSTRLSTTDELPSVAANRGLEPKKLSGLVRGELDWIVMKALEKDCNRRYDTASALAADVQHYLHDEPVQACPPSAWYRCRKFGRRNKGKLAVVGLLLFFLVLLGGGAGWVAWDRAVRQGQVAAEVGRALEETRARCRGDRLAEALAAAKRAERLLAGGAGSEKLRQQVQQAQTDVQMAARLAEIRLEGSRVKEGTKFDSAAADQSYQDVFQGYDLDVAALAPEQAAERIRASLIKDQLVAALDDWYLARRQTGRPGGRLLDVLQQADTDTWRSQFRAALRRKDNKALKDLARDPIVLGQPPPTVELLGVVLAQSGERSLAIALLRRAQQQHPNDFWISYALARHLPAGRPVEVIEQTGYYRVAAALRPESPGVHYHLGKALRAQGDLAGALAAFQKAIALKSDYAAAHGAVGELLRAQGDLDGAIAAGRTAIRFNPKYAGAHSIIGTALQAKGDLDGAIAAYQKAVALDPQYSWAHINLASALQAQGDLDGAIAAGRRGVELDPENAVAHGALADALWAQGDLDRAIAAYRAAIELDPHYTSAHRALGTALRAKGDLDGAIAAFEKAVALDPQHAWTHGRLADALRTKGDLEGVIAAYRQAIKLDPKYAGAYRNLGIALKAKGDLDSAIAAFQKAIALDPQPARAHSLLGDALWAKRDSEGAIAAYRRAIERDPRYAGAHTNLGSALRDRGDLDGAVAAHRQAITFDPKLARAHSGLGEALRAKGDLAGAVTAYQKAIALQPKDAKAHAGLGDALRLQGEFRQALAELRRGHELSSTAVSPQAVQRCQRLIELEEKLAGFLAGQIQPTGAAEQLELGELCHLKRCHRAALRFYEAAFAAQSKLLPAHRYNAARAAALAGCGVGNDVAQLDDGERERLRAQALGWLRDELTRWAEQLENNPPALQKLLRHWQRDPDLAGVREPDQLARLPVAEQEVWRQLWTKVTNAVESSHKDKRPE